MEKRALIALALSFAVFMTFIFVGEKLKKPTLPEAPPAKTETASVPAPATEAKTAPAPTAPATKPAAAPARPAARPAREVVVDTPLYRAVFTEEGARLQSFQLKKYRQAMPFTPLSNFKLGPVGFELERYQNPAFTAANPKELIRASQAAELPLGLSLESKNLAVPVLLNYEASTTNLTLKPGDKGTVQFAGTSPDGVAFTKAFTFKSDSYGFDLAVKMANHTGRPLEGTLNLEIAENYVGEEASRFNFLGFNSSVNNKLEEVKSGAVKEPKTYSGKVDWLGLDEGYFMTAVVPLAAPKSLITLQEPAGAPMVATLKTPVEALAPGQEAQFSYALYYGPKDLDDLKPLNLGLERSVNFGWFDALGKPLLYTLKFFDRYTHNYGWAIIILTILIRVLFFYPNHKSYKSMKEMQKLQPKVAKLREKYKDDKETMNKELMALYRTFKVNPLGGCLPMVLQLPVFIALYNVLGYAIELRHASFISTLPFTNYVWLADLSTKDPLLITPIVMGATMFIQQKMTPSAGDPAQAKMMMFLPLIFTFMFLNFASGLVLYWLVNNVLSIVQQYYTNKYLS